MGTCAPLVMLPKSPRSRPSTIAANAIWAWNVRVRIEWLLLSLSLQSVALHAQGEFVGSARCTVCHTQVGSITQKLHHESACESCHGPGLAHVEALDADKLAI